MEQFAKQYLPIIVSFVVIALVMWRRFHTMRMGRRVRPARLWIRPAIIVVILAILLATSPMPAPIGFGLFALAMVLGLVAGYFLVLHHEFTLDPNTGVVTGKSSPFGMILFFGIFAARFVFKLVFLGPGAEPPAQMAAHSSQIMLATDAMLVFLFALVTAQAWETWRRIKPLAAAHAAKTPKNPGQ